MPPVACLHIPQFWQCSRNATAAPWRVNSAASLFLASAASERGSPTLDRRLPMNSAHGSRVAFMGFSVSAFRKRNVVTSTAARTPQKVGDLIGHRPPEVRSTVGQSTKANSMNRARNRQNISHECHTRNLDSSFYSNNGGFISPPGSIRETLLPVPPPSPDGVSLLQERDGNLAGALSLPFSAPAFFFSTQNNNSHLGLSPGSRHANNPVDRT